VAPSVPMVHPLDVPTLSVPLYALYFIALRFDVPSPRNTDAFSADANDTFSLVFPVLLICIPYMQTTLLVQSLKLAGLAVSVVMGIVETGFPVPKSTLVSILHAVKLPIVRLSWPAANPVAAKRSARDI